MPSSPIRRPSKALATLVAAAALMGVGACGSASGDTTSSAVAPGSSTTAPATSTSTTPSAAAPGSTTTNGHASASTPPNDTFAARPVSGTGDYRRHKGKISIHLHPAGSSSTATRKVTVTVAGRLCTPMCAKLDGKLTGTLTPAQAPPDVGRSYALDARGTVAPLGRFTATGTVQGTGFIQAGHETITITLSSRRGRLTLSGESPPVPGRSSP